MHCNYIPALSELCESPVKIADLSGSYKEFLSEEPPERSPEELELHVGRRDLFIS